MCTRLDSKYNSVYLGRHEGTPPAKRFDTKSYLYFCSWLGLWHTFQKWVASNENPCDPRELEWNDFIDDTPVMAGASTAVNSDSCVAYYDGRRPLPDTCPGLPGKDPIWNFMVSIGRLLLSYGLLKRSLDVPCSNTTTWFPWLFH